MNILFSHPNFPGQFKFLIASLSQSKGHNIKFLTANERPEWVVKVLKKSFISYQIRINIFAILTLYSTKRVISAQTAFFKCVELKNSGFTHDLIINTLVGGKQCLCATFSPMPNLYLMSGILNRVVMHFKVLSSPDVGMTYLYMTRCLRALIWLSYKT